MNPFNLDIPALERQARTIRKDIVTMLAEAGSGHPGGSLGMADIFTTLYFRLLNHDPAHPEWPERDRLVLSNGHICPVLYASLARCGYFDHEELLTLRKLDSRLQGHPSRLDLPGVETSAASLGQGLGIAVGMALAARLDGAKHRIYAMMSDGELEEGSSWEAVNGAAKWRVDNLLAIVDRNNIQIDGFVEDIWPIEPLQDKFEAFNWHATTIDGHSIDEFLTAVDTAWNTPARPSVIIARTVPGKGVSFMEAKYEWHGIAPSREQAEEALAELSTDQRSSP